MDATRLRQSYPRILRSSRPRCEPLARYLREVASHLEHLPPNIKPLLFTQAIAALYLRVRSHALCNLLVDNVGHTVFGNTLSLTVLQLYGLDAPWIRRGKFVETKLHRFAFMIGIIFPRWRTGLAC